MKAEGEVELYVDLTMTGRAGKPCAGLGQQGIKERVRVFLPARGAYKMLLNSLNGHVPLREGSVFIIENHTSIEGWGKASGRIRQREGLAHRRCNLTSLFIQVKLYLSVFRRLRF
jgi:hypothetical protein